MRGAGTSLPSAVPMRAPRRFIHVPVAWLAAALLGKMAVDNFLLLGFLQISWSVVLLAILLATGCIMILTARSVSSAQSVSLATIAYCLAISILLLVLGGEGRLLYANTDWQVRDAVLADMARNPWPVVYPIGGVAHLLRAPIGMYLLPALVGGTRQIGLDMALLGCNAFVLTLLLALGSSLFPTVRGKAIALTVFVAFSGLDILGTGFVRWFGVPASLDHLERWAPNLQYSSTITLIFWVPQHAFAGWACAILYLLWDKGRLGIGAFAASIPLVALWSPLAIMGAVPFAILAAIRSIVAGCITRRDIGLAAIGIAVALPALVYLHADAGQLPSGLNRSPPAAYMLEILLEVAVYAVPLAVMRPGSFVGKDTLFLTIGCLLLMPIYRISTGSDFQMRASIMPLAILALTVADLVIRDFSRESDARTRRGLAITLALGIGAVTGGFELCRAVTHRAAPTPGCSLIGIWQRQVGLSAPLSTYLARLEALPLLLRPASVREVEIAHDPASCWDRSWRMEKRPIV